MSRPIPTETFKIIRSVLESFPANSPARSELAIQYLIQCNLPLSVSNEELLAYFFSGEPVSQDIWRWLYLLEKSIPYYREKQPAWYKRLLYFPATYIIESYLNRQTFVYKNKIVMLRFTDISGDHNNVHAGPGEDTADFYIYVDTTLFVDYKFASQNKFTSAKEVCTYYKSGKHMHKARLLLSFLEAEQAFYLINLDTDECQLLPIVPPNTYINTETIENYPDPLE